MKQVRVSSECGDLVPRVPGGMRGTALKDQPESADTSSNLFNYENQSIQNQRQQFQQEFQPLGPDLQSGKLSAAQSDFATLRQIGANTTSTSSSAGSNPLAQASTSWGRICGREICRPRSQDFANIQQDLQSQVSQGHGHHHHHGGSDEQSNSISQPFQQLGQSLQSGNVSSAQRIYNTIVQDLAQFGVNGQSSRPASGTVTTGVSVTA